MSGPDTMCLGHMIHWSQSKVDDKVKFYVILFCSYFITWRERSLSDGELLESLESKDTS